MASELVFINSSNPADSKSTAKRKAVRSQAAKDHSQSVNSKAEAPRRRRHRKLLSVQLELEMDGSVTPESDSSLGSAASGVADEEIYSFTSGSNQALSNPNGGLSPYQTGGQVLHSMPGAGWTYPFVEYPYQNFAPGILSRLDIQDIAVDIPALDHPNMRGSLRSTWFPMVVTNRATLDVVVLTAASHFVSIHQTDCKVDVLYKLKQDAISSINQSLRDPELATSDQIIAAVAKLAAYEAIFAADKTQYHIHMKGLTKMVELRGGLGTLGLNGLLARMLLWIDLNGAFILNVGLYFSHIDPLPGNIISGAPDPGLFTQQA
ncbi:MAG: hypothetical protein Q9220_004315 [cf. Caloplaca sp. 1 TL-2023]